MRLQQNTECKARDREPPDTPLTVSLNALQSVSSPEEMSFAPRRLH